MTDIVERLRQQVGDDHTRGCIQGRCYTCDCGYDEKTELLLREAADEITRRREDLYHWKSVACYCLTSITSTDSGTP